MEIWRGTLLIVDDDPAIRQLLFQRLAEQAFLCIVAADGEQALEEAKSQSFSVALLDLRLPGISGLEVLRQLRNIQPEACVLMVSGVADLATAVQAMNLGAHDYITKPFDLADLAARVDKALERHRLLVEQRHREKALEGQIHQQALEMRELVSQTVHSLVDQHLMEQELNDKGHGKRHKLDPKEIVDRFKRMGRGIST